MESILPILVLGGFVTLFGLFLAYGVSLTGPKPKQSQAKLSAYECGIPVQESGSTKMPVKFYLTAILFILFDIEIIFMYPWAISVGDFTEDGMGMFVLASMGVFLLIFIFGLFWEIKSKALEWE